MLEHTLLIIKPDAKDRGLVGKIISCFEDKNFIIKQIASSMKNAAWVELMYPHLVNNAAIYSPLVDFMTSDFLIGIELAGNNAVSIVRLMVGETDSSVAKPGTIRGNFGTIPIRYNCVHCSDSVENAKKEIEWFFGLDFEFGESNE